VEQGQGSAKEVISHFLGPRFLSTWSRTLVFVGNAKEGTLKKVCVGQLGSTAFPLLLVTFLDYGYEDG
jgi:hypothetical protein